MSIVAKEMRITKLVDGDIGVEIEVEGRDLPLMKKYWINEEDGSLKAAETREYVLAQPMSLKGVAEALDALDTAYKNNGTVVDDSVRAGVHIHINCQRLTMTQLYNFMTVYLILENVLVKWCGQYREGNLFCLRACDAEYLTQQIRVAAQAHRKAYKTYFHNDEMRYASMNVKALGDYGSLEFRAMRGTRDLGLIYKWAETLLGLREFAKTFNSPQEVAESFSLLGPIDFARRALGGNYQDFVCPNIEKEIWNGLRNAQDIAYCTDWVKFEPPMRNIGGLEFPIDAASFDEPEDDF